MLPWSYRVVGKGVREGGKARTVMMRFSSTSGFFAGLGWGCFLSSARKRQQGRGEGEREHRTKLFPGKAPGEVKSVDSAVVHVPQLGCTLGPYFFSV